MKQGVNRLSAEDWADAALLALEDGGLAAVAVEPLAKSLGATKGSFYWHFKNRDALIEAALIRWEQRGTDQVIDDVETEPDPRRRARKLFAAVIEHGATSRIELSLLASASHPTVAPMLERISKRRIDYVRGLLETIGIPPAEAGRRAIIGVSLYHGLTQLAHAATESLPQNRRQQRALFDSAMDMLLAGYEAD